MNCHVQTDGDMLASVNAQKLGWIVTHFAVAPFDLFQNITYDPFIRISIEITYIITPAAELKMFFVHRIAMLITRLIASPIDLVFRNPT